MGAAIDEAMATTDALLFGRRTYQTMAAAWPERAGDAFADEINAMKKYVASRTFSESDVTWHNTSLLTGETVMAEIRRLKGEDGGDISVMGSANLASQLIADGLVDEYRLMIEPIILGGGKRIFPEDTWARPLRAGLRDDGRRPACSCARTGPADRPMATNDPQLGCRNRIVEGASITF